MQPEQLPAPAPLPQPPAYEFITNPAPPRRGLFKLPGQSSTPLRLITIVGGVFVLLVIVVIVKNILSGGGPNFSAFVPVAQDQQELIHLSTNAAQQQGLTTTDQNFATTAELALTSSQTQLFTYLKNNHFKINTKMLNLKVSTSLDAELTTAAANSTYDQTFQQIIQSQLTGYEQALQQAFGTAGVKGRQLLNNDYQQAQLLTDQLNSPAS